MSQLMRFRQYRYLMKMFGRNGINNYRNYNVCFLQHHLQVLDLNCTPFNSHSFCQVREFAKRGGGKLMKSGKRKTPKLTDEEMADVIDIEDYRQQLAAVIEKLKKDYIDHLSLHSVEGNVENIIVKVDEEEYRLNEMAVISKKNPNLIAINMIGFPEALKPAIQAIIDSGCGLNPQQDGTMLYLNIPKKSKQQREILGKNAKSLFVKAKDEVRSIQNSFVKEAKRKTDLSEDIIFGATNQIMSIAEACVVELDKILKTMQKELLEDSES